MFVRSAVFTTVKIQVEVSVLPSSSGWRSNMDLWNVGIQPQHYTA